MILHIAHDEKFIDMAYRSFESVAPGHNHFVILSDTNQLRYIKETKADIIAPSQVLQPGFIKDLPKYDFVILHSLDSLKRQLVVKSPLEVKFLWIGWGFDYYNNFRATEKALFLPATLALFKKNQEFIPLVRSKLSLLKQLLTNSRHQFEECLTRIDYFAPVLPNEYSLCKKNFPRMNSKFVSWNYGNLEEDLSLPNLNLNGDNILLGNSASYANNHLEAIEVLNKNRASLPGNVIAPLSYGNATYQNAIVQAGTARLGEIFLPLVNFMPFQDYLRTISSCKYVIMNHLRQQAMGNIIMMLNIGASVFLQPQNPAYEFLIKNGAHVFTFDRLEHVSDFRQFALSKEQVLVNRGLLKKYWSRERVKDRTKNLIAMICAKN